MPVPVPDVPAEAPSHWATSAFRWPLLIGTPARLEPGQPVPSAMAWRGLLGCGVAAVIGGLSLQGHLLSGADLGGALGVSADEASWVTTAGAGGEGAAVLLAAPLVQAFGFRRVLRSACVGTAIFALAARLATSSLPLMIGARALEGFFCAFLPVVMMVWSMRAFPPARRGAPLALFAFASSLPSAVAAFVVGEATSHLGGAAMFGFDLVWAPLVAALVLVTLPAEPLNLKSLARSDWLGFALLSGGVVLLLIALNQGERRFWLETPWMRPLIGAAFALLALALGWLLSAKTPLLDLCLLLRPTFAIGIAEALSLRFGLLMASFAVPQALARLQGFRPEQAALALAWLAAGQVVGFFLGYAWLERADGRWSLGAGLAIFGVAAVLSARIDPTWSAAEFRTPLILAGLGQGLFLTGVMRYATWGLPPQAGATAAGLFNLTRVLGTSSASAAVGYFLRIRENFHSAVLVGAINDANDAALVRLDQLNSTYASITPDAGMAQGAATAALAQAESGQAFTLAFADIFLGIAAILFLFACLVVCLPRVPAFAEERRT